LKALQSLSGYALCFILLLTLAGVANAQQAGPSTGYAQYLKSTILSIFSDGSAEINQTLVLPANITTLTIPLFSSQVGNVLAVNQGGSPVSYSIASGNIALYTLGDTLLSLTYQTDGLTSKQGTVWDVSFNSPFNMSLVLPSQSTILSLSSAPTLLSTKNGTPTLVLAPGSWDISYGLALGALTVTKSTSATQSSLPNPSPISQLESPYTLGVGAVALVAALAALLARGRLRVSGSGGGLRFDDREILRFVKEKGGRAIEAEIRERFSLPRTSAWRQAKRLEKLGFVKISKLGTQNQVELLRGDFEQARDSP